MATTKKKTKTTSKKKSKPTRKATRAKTKTKTVVRYVEKPRNSASDDINNMTGTIGKLAITGAGAMMAMGIAGGVAGAMHHD
jgi:hypothetical protein